MNLIHKHIGLVFVLLFALAASLPLFQSGFYPMHDNEQVARLFDLNAALSEGQFPPRIAPNLGFGYGYPFFNFYPSFAYYVSEIFLLLGFGYILSTKLMLFAGFLLASFFAYILGKELFGRAGGIITSAFYTFAPYHAVDIYVRGAYAEFFSFVFLPAIFWAILKLARSLNPIYSAYLAVAVCFLILSHNLIFILFVPFIAGWIIYLFITETENRNKFLSLSALGLVLGFGASAYFSLPSYFERDFTLIRILTTELASYNLHFVCVHQLWDSVWGYGGSIPSCDDGLSFEVGKVALVASAAAVLGFLYSFFRTKNMKLLVIPILALMLAIAMFLSVRQSKIIWDSVSLLWYVQFPWRFLTLCVLFSSLLAGAIVVFIKDAKVRLIVSAALIALVIGFNFQYFQPEKYIEASDQNYVDEEIIRWDTSSLAYEYVPGNISTKQSEYGTTKVDITREEIKKEPYKIIKGIMIVKTNKDKSTDKSFDVVALTGGVLRINTFSFPGWSVYLDGKKVEYSDNNKLSLIDVKVPFGKHTIKAKFEDTRIRKFGNLVSVISIIVICFVALSTLKKHEKA